MYVSSCESKTKQEVTDTYTGSLNETRQEEPKSSLVTSDVVYVNIEFGGGKQWMY